MNIEKLIERYPTLYHMAERDTWPSIQARGLLSATAVLDHFGIKGKQRSVYEASQRREMVTIPPGRLDAIVLRDQKPMPPGRLQKALVDGTTPEEWYRLINGKVFMWAKEERLVGLLKARDYRNMEHDVLTIDTASLLKAHAPRVWLCHMNSGNTWPMPHARGKDSFRRIELYPVKSNQNPVKEVVEVLIDHSVPDIANHTLAVHRMRADEILAQIWARS